LGKFYLADDKTSVKVDVIHLGNVQAKKIDEDTGKALPNAKLKFEYNGTFKKLTIALWVLLIGSISFGVYKNFTAIDMHTVHEKEVIEKQIVDTNKVESYVESFTSEYFPSNKAKNPLIREMND
jgi:hypothetical protein